MPKISLSPLSASALQAWRNRLGWTRAEAAAQLNLKPDTYKKLENGQRPITTRVAKQTQSLESLKQHNANAQPSDAPVQVVGGGTIVPIRNHLALSAPAYGSTARELAGISRRRGMKTCLTLTRMADNASEYETNADMQRLADQLVANPKHKIVFWNPAICDFEGQVGDVVPGAKAKRLKAIDGEQVAQLVPTKKIVSTIRQTRKDLFLVAFKATTRTTPQEMYLAGLKLMKGSHINLVFVNDVVTRLNMIVCPEEARYHETTHRVDALEGLVDMALLRSQCQFTRSTVVNEEGVPWASEQVHANLKTVVEHCIERGAYKPVQTQRGAVTAGHFASRCANGQIVTTKRWSNFNELAQTGMVRLEPKGHDEVLAYGGKPSVGGQSQRMIFTDHPTLDNIVHFHCPLKTDAPDAIPVRAQRPYECGSHECGKNTSDGLQEFEPGIWATMLDQHGPNIVYGRDVDPSRVIHFIERNFDLDAKTGGLVA